jgi:bifunctional DNA-binding transcriptional regulator/antitoxin component of YhaV-PrlF toxin-antitoxin module
LTIVRLQEKKTRGKYHTYMITVPKQYVDTLGWKAGDKLVVELCEKDGKKGLFVYKL